jgi:hypothetical protein
MGNSQPERVNDTRPSLRARAWAFAGGLIPVLLLVGVALASPTGRLAATTPPAPANDEMANAQVVHGLPSTFSGTVVGASTELNEVNSQCASQPTINSVWYSLKSSTAQRIAVNLAAAGKLEAAVDIYHVQRSQLQSIDCQQTEAHGMASVSFKASKNGVYEIRVAALTSSQLAGFTLEVFLPTPAVRPPGPPLPAGGVAGKVDRVQNINAAYSFTMHSGVSYLINLANETESACVSGGLFAPGTESFEGGSSLLHIGCGGYRLYTPAAGQGGRYSFQVIPSSSHQGIQRFHLQVAVAGPAETAPGLLLHNYARARGRLDGRGIAVLHLYRVNVGSHSNLTLRLGAPQTADFNLQLRDQNGRVIECQCGGSGSQTLQRQLEPGSYYAVVSVRDATAGNFTLLRESRTITATKISFSSAKASPGQEVSINVGVSPAASGQAKVEIERFDPVFGWQFYRRVDTLVSAGSASVSFSPPAVGRFRARANYEGSRAASPSAVGFTYLSVA